MLKYAKTAAILLALTSVGCGTRPPIKSPDNLPALPVAEAVSLILEAHIDDIAAYRDCSRKHGALKEWISDE